MSKPPVSSVSASFLPRLVIALSLAGLAGVAFADEEDGESSARRSHPTWRVEFANDFMFASDNQFTNGFTVQKHSTTAADLDSVEGVWTYGKWFAKRLLPDSQGLQYRKALIVGQSMATPSDLEDPNIRLDDTPYFGLLAATGSWIAFDDTRFTGFGVMAGITGKYSLAEQVQNVIHSIIDSTDPQGWDHQLDTEPVLNLYFSKKRKIWNTSKFDGAASVDLAAGNFLTSISAGLETRIGLKPDGFAYIYDPMGLALPYDASLPKSGQRSEFYVSLVARARAWALFMPLDGNILVSGNEWTENNTIDPEHLVGQGIVGIHYVRPSWGAHINWTFNTDSVDTSTVAPDEEFQGNYGSATFEWRFK
jgi:lipid A 3-O-deacylase